MRFDELMREGKYTAAARLFAKQYYDGGKMGGTRKRLIEMLADKCDEYDELLIRVSEICATTSEK